MNFTYFCRQLDNTLENLAVLSGENWGILDEMEGILLVNETNQGIPVPENKPTVGIEGCFGTGFGNT